MTSGPERGECVCGNCSCSGNWTGPSCSCTKRIDGCMKDGVRLSPVIVLLIETNGFTLLLSDVGLLGLLLTRSNLHPKVFGSRLLACRVHSREVAHIAVFSLRSSTYSSRGSVILSDPRVNTTSYGLHSFSYSAAKCLNAIIDNYRTAVELNHIYKLLSLIVAFYKLSF